MKCRLIVSIGALVVLFSAVPVFAIRSIQGAVGEVTTADGAALGAVGFRIWSALPGGANVINPNLASCRNVRCIRSFITNTMLASPGAVGGGGYIGNQESTAVNNDKQDQPFYELVDAAMAGATANHIGYFGVSGVTANNEGVGNFLGVDCGSAAAQNCFGRIDANDAAPPLPHVPGGGSIKALGGMNPVPNVLVQWAGDPPPAYTPVFRLTWTDPPTYTGNMRPSTTAPAPPTPVIGVGLYRNDRQTGSCDPPAGNDPGWTKIGDFPLGAGSTGTLDTVPPGAGCRFYALTVRLIGPGGLPNEVETYVGINSQPALGDATVVHVVDFNVTYAGHGRVLVGWESGVEGGVRGYYVTRAPSASGPFSRVSAIIAGKGDGSSYSFTDSPGGMGARTYVYRLEVAGIDGGITTSSPAGVNLPARTMRGGPSVR